MGGKEGMNFRMLVKTIQKYFNNIRKRIQFLHFIGLEKKTTKIFSILLQKSSPPYFYKTIVSKQILHPFPYQILFTSNILIAFQARSY